MMSFQRFQNPFPTFLFYQKGYITPAIVLRKHWRCLYVPLVPGNVKKQIVAVVRKHFLDGRTAPRTAVMDTFH